MTHFSPDHPVQNPDTHNHSANSPLGSIDVEKKKQQIEDNIRRLTESMDTQSIPPTSDFDALDYAALSSTPHSEPFAEADPYVSPSESDFFDPAELCLTENNESFPPAKTIDEILQKLNGYQSEIESNEAIGAQPVDAGLPVGSQPAHASSTVPEMEVVAETDTLHHQETESMLETHPDLEETDPSMIADIPPVQWFSDAASSPQDLAVTDSIESAAEDTISQIVAPLVGNTDDSDLADAVFDVRNFSDSSGGLIQPIPGSQEVDPDFFEFNVAEESASPEFMTTRIEALEAAANEPVDTAKQPVASAPLDVAHIPEITDQPSINTEDQLFVANDGDVIKIDGADGFGYIDLVCFDVSEAAFEPSIIKIDAEDGSKFEIHHRQIPFAMFANDVKVELTPDDEAPKADGASR